MQQGKEITKLQMGLSHVGSRAHASIISTLHNKKTNRAYKRTRKPNSNNYTENFAYKRADMT